MIKEKPGKLRVMTRTDKHVAQLKLERVVLELDAMDLPCIAPTFGVTEDGTPDMVMVSDAANMDTVVHVLETPVRNYRASNIDLSDLSKPMKQ